MNPAQTKRALPSLAIALGLTAGVALCYKASLDHTFAQVIVLFSGYSRLTIYMYCSGGLAHVFAQVIVLFSGVQ